MFLSDECATIIETWFPIFSVLHQCWKQKQRKKWSASPLHLFFALHNSLQYLFNRQECFLLCQ
jgi:hypothetical protein